MESSWGKGVFLKTTRQQDFFEVNESTSQQVYETFEVNKTTRQRDNNYRAVAS